MYDFNCDDYVCPMSILSAVSSQRVEQHQKQTSDLFGDRIVKVDQIEEVKSAVCIGRKCAVWRFDADQIALRNSQALGGFTIDLDGQPPNGARCGVGKFLHPRQV